MESKKKKKLVLAFVMSLTISASFAHPCTDSCVVWYSSSSEIKIGGKPIKDGLKFDDKEPVSWHSENDAMTIVYYQSSTPKTFYAKDFIKEKQTSVRDYLTSSNMSTKGGNNPEETNVEIDTVFFLWDTLRIPKTNNQGSGVVDDVIIYSKADTIVSRITTSHDGKEFVIPRNAFGKLVSANPLFIDIIEKDIEKDWQYAVWRKLYVVPLPLKME
ncbi:MAG: hypothetical protein IJP44_00635 [Bacteroidales bacterium]|nr:hypothetical protein [Bacteroidales bacterium]